MAKILITGGTGLVGKHLTKKLQEKNHEVAILSRNPKEENQYKWDITKSYIDEKALTNTDYIIHLAGAGIADKRWTENRKKVLIESRVKSADLLFQKVKELNLPIKKVISASGIGFYGAVTSEKIYTENDNPHSDFIAKICIDWEKAIQQFSELDIPQTILRTSVVLANNGSALQKINTPLFLAAIGSGNQYFPYIHIEDLCNLYIKAIEDETFNGIYNAVATESHTINTFTKTLGKSIKKPVLPLNVPSFILKIVLGEMSDILLKGSRASTKKIEETYSFKYPTLKSIFDDIYKKKNS